jgi:hypothetical protein
LLISRFSGLFIALFDTELSTTDFDGDGCLPFFMYLTIFCNIIKKICFPSLVVVVGVLYAQVEMDGCVLAFVFGLGCFLGFGCGCGCCFSMLVVAGCGSVVGGRTPLSELAQKCLEKMV